ncbi:MAG: ribose ABC transporter [Cereibacter sphaeroides]|uniref:Ribose ABC transporter n=1 Tax=Cereibacter sphaeroides TaxID=1063 RepID=A0A2W5SAG9_CERSP|nr:MAG: ribose ABC transporter [Cereibacter sphaeroides]
MKLGSKSALPLIGCALWATAAFGEGNHPQGISEPVIFAPYDAGAGVCSAPSGLERTLAFARDNGRDFMRGVDFGLSRAAKDRGLTYVSAIADNDASKMIEQVEAFKAAKVGALVASPVDAATLAPHLQELIWSGAYVGTVVPPPATSILNAPQYLTGKVLAEAAATYIRDKLDGKANVVLLTHDSLEFLAPRFEAMRDVLRTVPGATIVADISPATVNNQGGYDTMSTILLAEPEIDVVLGADTVVLGALAAMRDAGRATDRQFFGGIDGEADAVQELASSNSPYKTSVSLASPVFGYAMGQHAADWLDGKSIPQAIEVLPIALTAESLKSYQEDMANPGAVYADTAKRDRYLRMFGNICFDTRDRYVNFAWSPEQR